ncbi:MAG: TolC family protein [Candidatus Omnitrophica bacterium]|nr:TolC family protein [Candidatus Omnitrophota bacterium]
MSQHRSLLAHIIITACVLGFGASLSFAEPQSGAVSEVEKTQHSIIATDQASNSPADAAAADTVKISAPKVLNMNECIEIAVRNNLPLKTTKKSVKLAEWRLWEARRNMLPKVGGRMEEYTGKIYGRRFYGRKQSVDFQWTVFHGGEFLFTMKQAEVNLKIVNREYARIKNELILQVKKGYYTLAKAKENLKFQEELSRDVARIYEMVLKQSDSGIMSNLELLNVNAQTNQVRFQLTSAKGDIEVAELILKQAMNVDVRERIDVEEAVEFKKIDADFESILSDAMVHRPEMQINSLMVSYYMYEMKVAKSKSWPKIDLLGSWGLAKEQFIAKDQSDVDDVEDLAPQWYGGVKVSIPLWGSTGEYGYTKEHWVPVVSAVHGTETITNSYKFNFLDNLAQYSEKYAANVDIDKARQELIKTKQDVTLEVKEACFNYEKALMQLDTAMNKVKYQESDLELTKFRRQMEEAQDSNVIESMIKLAQEKFGYVQAITDCNIAVASICKSVGIADYFKKTEDK